jgi:hypothetical protein
MLTRSLRFAILAILLSASWAALPLPSQTLSASINARLLDSTQLDPESLLAQGGRLPLACADMFALELVPGVSDSLASELLRAGPRIINAAQKGHSQQAALQIAKGVGVQKSHILTRFISVDGPCAIASNGSEVADAAR